MFLPEKKIQQFQHFSQSDALARSEKPKESGQKTAHD